MELDTLLRSWGYDDGTYYKEVEGDGFDQLLTLIESIPGSLRSNRERPDERDLKKQPERMARDPRTGEQIVIPSESNADRMTRRGITRISERAFKWSKPGPRSFEGANLPYSFWVTTIETTMADASSNYEVQIGVTRSYDAVELNMILDERTSGELETIISKL